MGKRARVQYVVRLRRLCLKAVASDSDVARVERSRDVDVLGASNNSAGVGKDRDLVIIRRQSQQVLVDLDLPHVSKVL